MKPILIIKTGSTLPLLKKNKGDFEDWMIKGSGLPPASFRVVDVENGGTLPHPSDINGIMITGSHSMVTERLAWSEKTAQWLAEAVIKGIPTLGICYGHQLLAYALGGQVDFNPNGREYGLVEIHLTPAATSDPLLKILPPDPFMFVSHSQTVISLPPGVIHLANSQKDTHQAFSFHGTAWGVQFHPEFDTEIMRAYIQASAQPLIDEGQDPAALSAACFDTPLGDQVLHRFIELAQPAV